MSCNNLDTKKAMAIVAAISQMAEDFEDHPTGVAICVLNARGVALSTMAMDDAKAVTCDTAAAKAKTALAYNWDTRDFAGKDWTEADLANARVVFPGLVSWGGGVLLRNRAGEVVGAIGVSGLTEEQDHELADHGKATLNAL